MRFRMFAVGAAFAAAAGSCGPIAQSDLITQPITVPPDQEVGAAEGAFRLACRGGHLSHDDPIVAPGLDDATHLHQFFGNLGVDENTDDASLASEDDAGSTCQGGELNNTAYWVPALIDSTTDQVVPIETAIVYYKGEPHHTAGPVEPLPVGLRMISDDGSWSCGGDVIGEDCGELTGTVNFRWCWNGELDSADHRSHLAESSYQNGVERCPSTHPRVIPRISYKVQYDLGGMGPSSGFSLSSDHGDGQQAPGGSTMHGDYMYGWYRVDERTGTTFDRVWYRNCLDGFRNCDFGDLGDGRRLLAYPDEAVDQQPSPAPPPLPA